MTIQLRLRVATIRDAGGIDELEGAKKPAARMRRRFDERWSPMPEPVIASGQAASGSSWLRAGR